MGPPGPDVCQLQELINQKTPTAESNIETSEEFKCDKCSYVCKREQILQKHITTKHQLEPEEVDVVIQNDT